ncbi:MAG: hypothetical protein IPL61_17995 [Myxococcales bacterium]|nr:hypothetical protein [Myxococcales bacterium]
MTCDSCKPVLRRRGERDVERGFRRRQGNGEERRGVQCGMRDVDGRGEATSEVGVASGGSPGKTARTDRGQHRHRDHLLMRVALAIAIAGALACSNARRSPDMRESETRPVPASLEAALGDALADGVGPDELAARIGRAPIIDTRDERDRNAMRMADIRPDPTFQATLPALGDAERVIYWKVDENAADVIVSGVSWQRGQPGVVFRGLIGPP